MLLVLVVLKVTLQQTLWKETEAAGSAVAVLQNADVQGLLLEC